MPRTSNFENNNRGENVSPPNIVERHNINALSTRNFYNGSNLNIPSNEHLIIIYNLLQLNIKKNYEDTLENQEANKKNFKCFGKLMEYLINCSFHFSTAFSANTKIISASINKRYYSFYSKDLLYVLALENNSNFVLYEINPNFDKNVIKYSIVNNHIFCARDTIKNSTIVNLISTNKLSPSSNNFTTIGVEEVDDLDEANNPNHSNINVIDNEIEHCGGEFTIINNCFEQLDHVNYYLDIYDNRIKIAVILFEKKFERDNYIQFLNKANAN